jgi:small conductance mechanosensitive channel
MNASGLAVLPAQVDPVDPGSVEDACGEDAGVVCRWVYEITDGHETLATLAGWFVDRPLRILIVLGLAWAVARAARRVVRRVMRQVVAPDHGAARARLDRLGVPGAGLIEERPGDPISEARRQARALSISNVLGSTIGVAVWTIAGITALGIIGIELGPLIAGAGIAGVALGFGAQSLVRDCIAGLFMLMEDQYGIGDVVDLGEAVGTVERITLRATVLRSLNGTVWHVPNGEVRRVGNLSQMWSVAVIDVDVAYDTDIATARRLIEETAREVCASEAFAAAVIEEPTVLGVEALGADGITIRLTVKVEPGTQWALQRSMREALKSTFDRAGVEIPFPQRTLWIRGEQSGSGEGTPTE